MDACISMQDETYRLRENMHNNKIVKLAARKGSHGAPKSYNRCEICGILIPFNKIRCGEHENKMLFTNLNTNLKKELK